jgi:cathepsin D
MIGSKPLSDPRHDTVDFDTGSSDLFLPTPMCGANCSGHKLYDPSASSTAKDLLKTFSLSYVDGSTVEGEQFTDVVSIAGLTV